MKEVNDQHLENVSGGAGQENPAAKICGSCLAKTTPSAGRCEGGEAKLNGYIERSGPVYSWSACPYLKRFE